MTQLGVGLQPQLGKKNTGRPKQQLKKGKKKIKNNKRQSTQKTKHPNKRTARVKE